jgi:hypothetical protein
MDEDREAEDFIEKFVMMHELHWIGVSAWETRRKHHAYYEGVDSVSNAMGPNIVKCQIRAHLSRLWEY